MDARLTFDEIPFAGAERPWTPPESPLAMPQQAIDAPRVIAHGESDTH